MAKIKPLDDRVVVKPNESEQVTAGGIVLPDSAQEKPQLGTITATGPGKLLDSGERGEMSLKVGDEVFYGKYVQVLRGEVDHVGLHTLAQARLFFQSS